MLYFLAITFPPLACLCAGKFWWAVLTFFLDMSCIGYPAAAMIAWVVVRRHHEESRQPLRIYGVYDDRSSRTGLRLRTKASQRPR